MDEMMSLRTGFDCFFEQWDYIFIYLLYLSLASPGVSSSLSRLFRDPDVAIWHFCMGGNRIRKTREREGPVSSRGKMLFRAVSAL